MYSQSYTIITLHKMSSFNGVFIKWGSLKAMNESYAFYQKGLLGFRGYFALWLFLEALRCLGFLGLGVGRVGARVSTTSLKVV